MIFDSVPRGPKKSSYSIYGKLHVLIIDTYIHHTTVHCLLCEFYQQVPMYIAKFLDWDDYDGFS